MIISCLVAISTSALMIGVLRRSARALGLLDHPDERKQHRGSVPLVGGLSIFFGIAAGALVHGHFHEFGYVLLGTAAVVVLLGALDDRLNLSVRIRLLVQTIVILVTIASTGVYIHTLGHIFGHELELGWLGIPLTVVAVIGLLNAFNMMDGIDGLAGSMTLVSIAAITLFAGTVAPHDPMILLILLSAAIWPYLVLNLGLVGRKIFMGDAGSMLIGYLLAWTLIGLSQQSGTHLSPVDVLWCVALPVLDTFAVMYRRLRQGKSPFKPDRGHVHHILMDMGLSPRGTLVALVALAASIAFLGNVAQSIGAGAGSNLAAFCLFAGTYIIAVTRLWARQQQRTAQNTVSTTTSRALADGNNVLPMINKHTESSPVIHSRSHAIESPEAANASE